MAVPKRKASHRRTHIRSAHWTGALTAPGMTACPHCGEMIMNYSACPACGYYRGRKVLKVAADKAAETQNAAGKSTGSGETPAPTEKEKA